MRLKILYHGNCFDGCASAALFGRFFEERIARGPVDLTYAPVQHQQGDPFPPGAFDGDVNACVDFRFSPSPELHWWFDHHASAFQPSTDRAVFERDRSGQKFWDPAAPSCTGFIARTLEANFGWTAPDREELLRWADIIDAARFPTAAMAVRLEEPALRLMALLEATRDPALPARIIEALRTRPLAEIAAEPWVAGPLVPILERHFRSIDTVRKLARVERGVVEIDLSEPESRARTSSSPTTSSRRRATRSWSLATPSAPRCRSARTRGRRSRARTISPGSARAMAAAGTRSSGRSRSNPNAFLTRAAWRGRSLGMLRSDTAA